MGAGKKPIKALFFDVDGTLVSFKTHSIPTSTIESLKEAKRNGVKIIIATGRPYFIINNLDEIKPLVDGWITTNGAHCFIGDKTIYLQAIESKTVHWILEECAMREIPCLVVGTHSLCTHYFNKEANDWFVQLLNIDCQELSHPLDEVLRQPIIQLTTYLPEEQQKEIFPPTNQYLPTRWHPAFNDITSPHADKGIALEAMTKALGLSIEETAAFGDGGNDLPMIRKAGIGIAMGNSMPEVQGEADYITSSVDDDGIKNALHRFGVIL